jgi:cytoskeletal protein CcmA (bactofilin family)
MDVSGEEKMREYEKRLRQTVIHPTRVSGSSRVNIPGMGEIRVSGSGYVSAEEIKISGSGYLPGGVKVGRISCSGSVSIGGDIETEEARFAGSASIDGSINSKNLSASGSFKAEGDAKGGSMRFAGSCKIGNDVTLEDSLIAHGSLTILGNVTAKRLVELSGRFDIGGKLTTSHFEAELRRSRSHIRDGIQADYVNIRKRGKVEGLMILGFPIFGRKIREGRLRTTDIVGKEKVYLENVVCDNVTGKHVIIGEGCEVKGRVKYFDTVEVHPEAVLSKPPEKVKLE